ncbi:MAG TPA: DUF4105 domain-containing protein [Burkholderiaceae bacterium]
MRQLSDVDAVAATARAAGWALLGSMVIAAGAWSVAALLIAGPRSDAVRQALAAVAGAVALATLIALALPRWRRRVLGAGLVLFAAVLLWWSSLEPSNDRDWVAENARLAYASIDGDAVTVHNVRNFAYRSETDFTPAYYDKRFDLKRLEGVDLVASYWMGPAIAHIFLSFAFAGGDHLAVSIETRKEKGEGYSTVNGFFRQYELYYVVADERDVIGLRTNFRQDPPEQVHVFRLKGNPDGARRVFLDYMASLNALKAQPEFYNSLTTNCTTTIWTHSLVNPGHVPLDWRILASGHVPEYLYGLGRLEARDLSFAELQQRSLVNARAQQAGAAADFSSRIRLDAR